MSEIIKVRFDVDAVINALDMLHSLATVHIYPKHGEWVHRTLATLPPDVVTMNQLLMNVTHTLYHRGTPEIAATTFPDFIDQLERTDPVAFRNDILQKMLDECRIIRAKTAMDWTLPTLNGLLLNVDTYLYWLSFARPNYLFDGALNLEAHALLNDPARLHVQFVAHLRLMWGSYLRADWERWLPFIEQCVTAYRQQDYTGLDIYQTIERLTGRDLRGGRDLGLDDANEVIFIPAVHLAHYVGRWGNRDKIRMAFQARLPEGG
jgi:hypothetical protein